MTAARLRSSQKANKHPLDVIFSKARVGRSSVGACLARTRACSIEHCVHYTFLSGRPPALLPLFRKVSHGSRETPRIVIPRWPLRPPFFFLSLPFSVYISISLRLETTGPTRPRQHSSRHRHTFFCRAVPHGRAGLVARGERRTSE